MAKLLVLSGIPGSGKSFFSKGLKIHKKNHLYIVSSDAIRNIIFANQQDFSNETLVWKMFYEMVKVYALDKEGIVILDSTNANDHYRVDCMQEIAAYFEEKILVLFNIDKETAFKQNDERPYPVPKHILKNFVDNFQLPTQKDRDFYNRIYVIENRDFDDIIKKI